MRLDAAYLTRRISLEEVLLEHEFQAAPADFRSDWERLRGKLQPGVPMTTTCGSGPSLCSTKLALRKWRVASHSGLSSASNLPELTMCRAPNLSLMAGLTVGCLAGSFGR